MNLDEFRKVVLHDILEVEVDPEKDPEFGSDVSDFLVRSGLYLVTGLQKFGSGKIICEALYLTNNAYTEKVDFTIQNAHLIKRRFSPIEIAELLESSDCVEKYKKLVKFAADLVIDLRKLEINTAKMLDILRHVKKCDEEEPPLPVEEINSAIVVKLKSAT